MRLLLIGCLALGALAFQAEQAGAAACANGVYRAGCAGPNGAVVATKPHAAPRGVHCANGAYHAGCVGPNGAVATSKGPVTRGPGGCYWRNGAHVCP